ncbi:MAG: chromosome segregation protein SMC, partial [Lysobacterales bacterium]
TEGIDTVALNSDVETLEKKDREVSRTLAAQQKQLARNRDELKSRREKLREETQRQHELQGELSRLEGRLESLRALQQAARESGRSLEWLQQNGLASAPRLLEKLEVEKGWEAAAETVLGFWLESVLVDDPAALATDLGDLLASDPDGVELTLVAAKAGGGDAAEGSLAEKIIAAGASLPRAIGARLERVRTAESLSAAVKAAADCGPRESVITKQGEWLGPGWIRVAGSGSGQAGKLQRKQQIKTLQTETSRLAGQVSKLEQANRAERAGVEEMEQSVGELQQQVNALHRDSADLSSRLDAGRTRISELGERKRRVTEEAAALKQQRDADEARIKHGRAELAAVLEKMAKTEEERKALDRERVALLERRDKARASTREVRERRHQLALKTESQRASLESLRQSLQRMDTQFSQLQQRFLALSEQVAKDEDPQERHREEMDALLQKRIEVEQRLTQARSKLQQLEEEYRELDAKRQQSVQKMEGIRGALENARLQQQELELNARSLRQQVEKLGQDIEALAADLPDEADEPEWEEKLERLGLRITRLEPVNLAAISEYEEELKRKEYMDAQHEDLVKALETLEDAIKTIDRKTRTRFKDTFEKVNKGIQELFPRLFGGGHAYLELTGDDLLTTGVAIMARPPGKRISNIQLLSGGEKALTAVSFVFAIFRLNPAPFCLLDEVDAPLDDANVSRFTEMVKEMSESIQFIVVTHNKITMELAHQLSGVTMSEPGVSRLVQVDINEAARLAGE